MKFSEIPHFIIYEYIKRQYQLESKDRIVDPEETKNINPDFIFKDRTDKHYWQNTENFTWSGVEHDTWFNNSYLLGPRTTFITQGGNVIDLFIKINEKYVPINFRPREDFKFNENMFKFTHLPDLNEKSDLKEIIRPDIKHFNPNNNEEYWSYEFEVYDLWDNKIDIENGSELYFRYDSVFHNWLRNNAPAYLEDQYKIEFFIENYINVNKPFIYLGTIYNDRTKNDNVSYLVFHYNIKDFVVNAVPFHQRTENLKSFFKIFFDILYNIPYASQKNIWSILDPLESRTDFIEILATYYDIDIRDIEEERSRWLLLGMPNIMKTKGTYSCQYNIYKHLTSGSKNRLNIYERWHDNNLVGDINESDYEDYLYTSAYKETDFESGAGESWYLEYFNDENYPNTVDEKIISTQYITEIDLTTEPIDYQSILKESTINSLYRFWESFRPINRTTKYKLLLSPITDFSTSNISLYSRELVPYLNTKNWLGTSHFDDEPLTGTHIDYFSGISKVIRHQLSSKNLHVELYDDNLIRLNDDEINSIECISNNRVQITLNEEKSVFSIIKRADYSFFQDLSITGIRHPYNTGNVVTQFYKNNNVVSPRDVQRVGNDRVYTWTDEADKGVVYPSNFTSDFDSSNNITIYHPLNCDALIIDVYDNNRFKIYPKNIKIVDETRVDITFDENKSGRVLLTKIGKIGGTLETGGYISNTTSSDFTLTHNIGSQLLLIHVYDNNFNMISPQKIEIIDDNNVNIVLNETIETYTFIKGITPSDEYGYILDDYTWIITTLDLDIDFKNSIVQFYNDDTIKNTWNYKVLDKERIILNDENINKAVFSNINFKLYVNEQTDVWEIEHNLESLGNIINVYDENWEPLEYNELIVIDQNNIQITFSEPQTGYILITKVGNPSFEWLKSRLQNSKLTLSSEQDNGETFEYEIDLVSLRDENNYFYLEYFISKEVQINISEMTLKDNEGIIFYTECSELFKSNNFEMNIFYRISKINF